MKNLTNHPQLNATLGLVAAHANLTSFGLISNKELFAEMREQEIGRELAEEKQNSFERLSEQLYLRH